MRLFNEMFMLCVDSVFLAILPSRKAVLCPFIRAMSLVNSWWNPCSLRILWCGSWISWADKIWIVDYFVVLVCEALVISPPIWLLCHRFGDKIALIQLLPNKQLCFQLDLLGHIWVGSCIANLSKGSYEQRPQCLHSIFGQCQLVRMWAGFNLLCLQTHLVFQC